MQNFKQYLLEADKKDLPNFAPWHLTDPVKIRELIKDYKFQNESTNYQVLKNGTVKVKKDSVHFRWHGYSANGFNLDPTQLPFKFNSAFRNFTIHSDSITDIWGAPDIAEYLCIKATKLETLEHLEGEYKDLALYCPELSRCDCKVKTEWLFINALAKFDAKDFAKSFASLNNKININLGPEAAKKLVNQPLLSLIKIKDFKGISFNDSDNAKTEELKQLAKACDIITKHSDNIVLAQKELYDNDLDEYAEL